MLSAITRNVAIKPAAAMVSRAAASRAFTTVTVSSMSKQDLEALDRHHPQAMPLTDSTVYAQQATLQEEEYAFSTPVFSPTVNVVFDD